MINKEQPPCTGCTLQLCDLDPELFEDTFPFDECWDRYDRRLQGEPGKVIDDLNVVLPLHELLP